MIASALLLGACGATPEGVWRLLVEVHPPAADECRTELTHNLEGGYTPDLFDDDDSPWTGTSEETWSEQVSYGLVILSGETRGSLVLGELVLTGEARAGEWTFSWENTTDSSEQLSHASGYAYTQIFEQARGTRIVGRFEADTFEGDWFEADHRLDRWTESDLWSEEVVDDIGPTGAIPFALWLERREGEPVNTWADADCTSSTCLLSVADDCDLTFAVHGTRTSLDPGAYDAVSGAGQQAGY